MAYTPTTWNTGDTITATAMNKIEQGIANGGGGGAPLIHFITRAFGTYSHVFNFALCKYDSGSNSYIAQKLATPTGNGNLTSIVVYGGTNDYYINGVPSPTNDLVLVFIEPPVGNYDVTVSGNISQTTVLVNYGSLADARIITGDCEIDLFET